MGGVDLTRPPRLALVAPGTPPGGFAIDGTMDDGERAFNAPARGSSSCTIARRRSW